MDQRRIIGALIVFASVVSLAACTSTESVIQRDSGPAEPVDVSHIPDAVPRLEPRTAAGNKSPYTVLGKTYRVMDSSDGYRERGIASWYGQKFHGAQTSNGEIYDMYGMTAAHKSLPIPTFVKVRNLANGKEVIVRVNDRGPFHDDRIIDLTYAAAMKLGFAEKGTAEVEVAAIDPAVWTARRQEGEPGGTADDGAALAKTGRGPMAPAPEDSAGYRLPANTYLQAGAFTSEKSATALREKLAGLTSLPVAVTPGGTLKKWFRVRVGPIADNFEMLDLKERIQQLNLGIPHVVRE